MEINVDLVKKLVETADQEIFQEEVVVVVEHLNCNKVDSDIDSEMNVD
jgi:hypothetical protein